MGLEERCRSFAQYLTEYIEVGDAIYNKDQEEAINFLTQMQTGQESEVIQNDS